MSGYDDVRAEPRDEVMYRSRMTLADRRQYPAKVVNISPSGLMLRSDAPVSAGEWIKILLPLIGDVDAAVRWALGGRIGCELDRPITAADYRLILTAMGA